jgi:hypothetical protein
MVELLASKGENLGFPDRIDRSGINPLTSCTSLAPRPRHSGSPRTRVATGRDKFGNVDGRLSPEKVEHACLVPDPDGGRLREGELRQQTSGNRRAPARPQRPAAVVRAGELDRKLAQPCARRAKRKSQRRLGVLAQPAEIIHADSVPAACATTGGLVWARRPELASVWTSMVRPCERQRRPSQHELGAHHERSTASVSPPTSPEPTSLPALPRNRQGPSPAQSLNVRGALPTHGVTPSPARNPTRNVLWPALEAASGRSMTVCVLNSGRAGQRRSQPAGGSTATWRCATQQATPSLGSVYRGGRSTGSPERILTSSPVDRANW